MKNIKKMFLSNKYYCLFQILLIGFVNSESIEEEDIDQYFGVPLGALHFSSDGTSAEIYAADEFTIIFNHFYHNPRHPGCTAMMIGPPRKDDKENVVEGHGLLLTLAHPPVAANKYKLHRVKRKADNDFLEQFRGWPMEFDHLLMPAEPQNSEKIQSNNSKIQIHKLNNLLTTIATTDTTTKLFILQKNTTNDLLNSTPNVETNTNAEQLTTINSTIFLHKNQTTTISQLNNETLITNITVQTPTITTDSFTTEKIEIPKNTNVKPLILFGSEAKQQKTKNSKNALQNQSIKVSTNLHSNNDVVNKELFDNQLVKKELIKKEFSTHNKNLLSKKINFNSKPINQPTNLVKTTTPLYYVINDPRESRRQRLLELHRQLNDGKEIVAKTTTELPDPKIDFSSKFELPVVRDKLATFSLTNGAKINHYKWIGVYDQCLKRHISLVSLRDIDPPREEKISPLSGWSHNITSYRLHILNCNTILIPGFTYDGQNTTKNTYFYFGIGEFPNNIEMQTKCIVVGASRDEPLKNYNGEDVLLRLPKGYRTFDIDFISVYNTDERKSFGHVLIPSLLVPPCADD